MRTYLFWMVQFTWGIPLNALGAMIAIVLILKGHQPKRFGHGIYFEIGRNWGGVNFGGFFFVQKNASQTLKSHEYGHCFQNMMLGILMPFAVNIPSAIRYHYRNYQRKQGKALPPYDDFWCEKWATKLGEKHCKEK
ncbi:hypothetical protein R4Z10_18790 [Niallia sp. XMNu-256]|uniref:hypothetical protein n=1 Tax=Niallia sp. XMNu-256 TaxID=3082444 RepID=UPI0030D356DD